jgi:hypothetical protein
MCGHPIFRVADLALGQLLHITSHHAYDVRTGTSIKLEPGIYAHCADPRTDAAMRAAFDDCCDVGVPDLTRN